MATQADVKNNKHMQIDMGLCLLGGWQKTRDAVPNPYRSYFAMAHTTDQNIRRAKL